MSELRSVFATLALCALLLAAYAITGPALSLRTLVTFPEALAGVFRHGSLTHLAGNILVIFFGGLFAEPRLGTARTVAFFAACGLLGALAQFYFVGPFFIGASGISYGLLAYGTLAERAPRQALLFGAMLFALLLSEWVYLSGAVAVYVHMSGALVGGTLAMFEAIFGSKNPTLKPMQMSHVSKVVEIIAQTDEDDALEAETEFLDGGLDGMFVLMQRNEVLGVTGYSQDEQVGDIAWLSWTYLSKEHVGAGLGGQMLNDLLGKLKDFGVRKIFIATSDFEEDGQQIYAAAHKMYADFGAEVELTIPDFHNVSEAKIIYGLNNPEFVVQDEGEPSENTGLAITGIAREAETDGVMGLQWEERPIGLAGIEFALEKAAKKKARMVVLAIPSDISDENDVALEAHSFKKCGMLENYYNSALHQVWWICSLDT